MHVYLAVNDPVADRDPSRVPPRVLRAVLRGLLNVSFFGTDSFVPLALTHVRGTCTAVAGLTLRCPPSRGRPAPGCRPATPAASVAGWSTAASLSVVWTATAASAVLGLAATATFEAIVERLVAVRDGSAAGPAEARAKVDPSE